MVRIILGLDGSLAADQADALAVALSHAHSSGARFQTARGRGSR